MQKSIFKKALSCLLVLVMVIGILPAGFVSAEGNTGITYYADAAAGSDTNTGTAPDQAFKSLYKAAQVLNPGDTLLIKGGVYPDYFLIINKGSDSDSPITIKNYDNNPVIIHKGDNDPDVPQGWHGSGWTNNVVVYLNNSKNIDISGLEIHYAGQYAPDETPAAYMTAVLMYGCSNIRLHNCAIHNAAQGISFRSNCNNISVYNNRIFSHLSEGIKLAENAKNIRVFNNIISSSEQGLYLSGESDSFIYNNLIYDNKLALRAEDATGNNIVNNTFSGSTDADMIFGNISGNRIINNILTNGMWSGSAGSYTNNTFEYNCYTSEPMNPMSATEFKADPGFTDAANKNFTLTDASPCIREGSSDLAPQYDFYGKERVSPADIGACAYGNVYYLSQAGNDSNSGSSEAPFATIGYASSVLHPGDTLYIKAGTYEGSIAVPDNSASANNTPIIISSYDKDQVIVKGQNGLDLNGGKNIFISGLTFDGNAGTGAAASLNNVANSKVYGCRFINSGTGMQISGNTSSCEIYNNNFDNTAGKGIEMKDSASNKIYNNIFNNNICINNEGDTALVANSFINNNIFNSYGGGSCMVLKDTSTGNTIENNIFNSAAGKAIDIASLSGFYTNNTADYNCYDSAAFAALPENAGANDVLGDPKYVDAVNKDYHIVRGSVCIDKGNDKVAPALDPDRTVRYGTSDIGVFEYIKPNVSITGQFPEGSGISTTCRVKVTFADELAASITTENIPDYITVEKLDGTAVSGTFEVGAYQAGTGTVVTFTPAAAMDYETEYKVTVKGTISNVYNDTLGEDYSWTFKTATKWGNDLVHPALLFSEKDGTLQELQKMTTDYTDTPYNVSTAAVWDKVKAVSSTFVDEKFYCDKANRPAIYKNYFYFYYPYMLEPVNHEADNSLQVGDNTTANSYAIKNITSPSKEDYFINFDFKPIKPENAKDYIIWSSYDGTEYDDIIVKMSNSKLYYTDGSADNFVEVPEFTFANDTWYNIFINVKADGTVNLMVNGDAVDVTANQIGSGKMTAIGDLGCKADGATGMAYFDNIRVYDNYVAAYHEKFSSLNSSWTTGGAVTVPSVRQPSHFEPQPTYYWTAITSDLQTKMQNMALTYIMLKNNSPEEAAVYGAKTRDLIMSIANWSVWCDPEEGETASLDTGYLTTGMAFAYDMIYDFLTAEERSVISKAIKEKGVDVLYKSATEPGSYGNYDGKDVPANTTFVQNAAMGLGALAIGKEYDASYALDRAREIIETAYRNGCDRDGAWVEGSVYGDLAIINALPFHDADARVTGHDVIKTGYLSKLIDFPLYIQFPSGRTYSMVADSGDWSYQYKKIMEYYAKYDLNEYAAWCLQKLDTMKNSGDMLSFLWHPGHKQPVAPTDDTKALGKLFNDMGLATFKTGWGTTDTMASLKSSKRTGNMTHHTHLDQNSVELVRGDSQLLSDPAYQDYSDGPRKDFTLATGHNIFVLDGKYQNQYGFGGQIENFYMGDKYGFSVGEAGLSYQTTTGWNPGDMPEWRRSLVNMVDGKYYVMFDDYQMNSDNRNLVWQLNTQGQTSIDAGNSTVMARKGNDYLGIKLINSDISKIKTEENLYAFPSAYVKKAIYVSVPKSVIDTKPTLSITLKYTSYVESEIKQYVTGGTASIGHLQKSGSFPGGIMESTFTLDNDYYDSIPATADMVDIRLDISDAVFIESMSVTDGKNTDTTLAADKDADTAKDNALSIYFEPKVWRDAFKLGGATVRGNHASERIYMNADNGRENHNILTLLYPSGDGSMPKTHYLKDADDNGVIISRGNATDLVLFHKDSVEPVVLANATHKSLTNKFTPNLMVDTDTGRVNKLVLKYTADRPCNIVQIINGGEKIIGTITGDGSTRVDAFTLGDDPSGKILIRFTGNVTVSDVWSASANKITEAADASDIKLDNPDGYYDVLVDYKQASEGAVVKQNGVIIGRLADRKGIQKVELQKPYVDTIDIEGKRTAKVSITVEGATVNSIKVVENSRRTQLGKTMHAGGDNDTAMLGYNVPGVSIYSKEPYKEVEPFEQQWSGKSVLDGVTVRYGYAGAQMYVNSMNTRNLYKVYIKYQSAADVDVYQYSSWSDKTKIGVLKGGNGWQVAALDLKGYTIDLNGYNYVTNRVIEFGGNLTVSDAWLELASADRQVDYTIVGAAGDNSISKHAPGLAIGDGWSAAAVNGGVTSRTSVSAASIFASISDLTNEYYVNIKYKSKDGARILQRTGENESLQVAELAASADWNVVRFKLDSNYLDTIGQDGLIVNVQLNLDGMAEVSDMWLEKEPGGTAAKVTLLKQSLPAPGVTANYNN